MKAHFLVYILLFFVLMFVVQAASAEDIHFNNDVYTLKLSRMSDINRGYENEYYPKNNSPKNWRKMIGIYYYPNIKDPIKFAQNADKEIETKTSVVLLKFVANRKQQKAVLSFLELEENGNKPFFEHNIYKYEPHPKKGMMILKYTKKYFYKDKDEVTKIGHEIKKINDDMIEQIIISPVPPVIEKEIQ